MAIDPITAEVVAHYLLAASEEMGTALIKAAFSTTIKERQDCSTAIFNAEGDVIAQATRVPLHLGSMIGLIRHLRKRFALEDMAPGDMFCANDPYNGGGSHLPDISVVAPVFVEGRVVGFVANIAHHSDVGGIVAGSQTPLCTSIFQEGLRIPPVRIMRDGAVCTDVFDMILLNSRLPEERDGDLRAQFASNTVGIRAVQRLFAQFGTEMTLAATSGYLDYTERRIVAAIGTLKPGVYEAEDFVSGDVEGELARIHLKLTVTGEALYLDFSETAGQLKLARNVTYQALDSTVYSMLKALLDPEVPANEGCFRPIHITTKPGTIVAPLAPAPVNTRLGTCVVIGDVVAAALSQAAPGKALAPCGPHQMIVVSGTDPRTGSFFVDHETLAGGLGARSTRDGMDAVRVPVSGASNLPVEVLERAFPIRIERYALREGSGGPGAQVGGNGIIRDYRILADGVTVSLSSGRHHAPARGIEGAGDAASGGFTLHPDSDEAQALPSAVANLQVPRDSLLRVSTSGGGGFGPPRSRDRERIAQDIREGRINQADALRLYGYSAG